MAEDFPDVMGDLRTWARTATSDLVNGPVAFKFPAGLSKYPAIRLTRVGGGPQPGSEAPIEDVRVVFDVWGHPDRAPAGTAGTFADVTDVVRRLTTRLHALSGPIGSSTHVLDADVTSVVQGSDPDGGAPRVLVTALLTVRNQ